MKIQTKVEEKVTNYFTPEYLEVVNESYKHSVPEGSESHFKMILVSAQFEGQNAVKRHRMVNRVLAEELAGPIHALSLKLLTPAQWAGAGHAANHETPDCAHGKGR